VVLQLIGDLAHRQARTVLFTTHDPNHALQVASHTLLLLPDGEWLAGDRRRAERNASPASVRPAGTPDPPCRLRVLCWRRGLRCVAERHKTRLPEPLANVAEDKAIQGQRGGIALRRASW
jgi:energy-coupling factor transporter ATP-binding protein EcfA2